MRHRWKWISALIIAAVIGVGWWLRQPSPPPVFARLAADEAPPPIPAPIAPVWPGGTSHARTAHQGDSGEIEVCGLGKLRLDPDDPAATGKYLDALTKMSRLRWLAALRNSDDYRARASGLYLEGILDRDSPQQDPDAAREELVQLAVATKDPAAFALAYTKCIKGAQDLALQDACPQLTLDDWARADADNAVPWLQMAAKARRESDAAAEAAAMAHAAQAHQYEPYTWSLFSFAQPALPDDMTAAERWILTTKVIGVEAAMPMPYLPLMQYCSHDAQSDAAVHQQCDALAELMVNKGGTLLDLSAGKALGIRIGWPKERVDSLTLELHASMQALNQMMPSDPKQQWGCDSAARGNALMSEWIELGERGLAGRAIERSGETVAELSRKYDDWMATAGRTAAAPQP